MTATLGVGMSQGLSKMSARGAGASVNVWAEFAVLLAALSYALSAIFARRMPAFGLKPIDVAAGQATTATAFLPQEIGAREPDDAGHAGGGSNKLEAVEFFLGRQDMRGEDGEERCRCVEDRGEAARQMRLSQAISVE